MITIGLRGAVFGLAALSASFVACAGTLDDPGAFKAALDGGTNSSCGDVPSTIFAPSCAVAGCHSPPTSQSGLDLLSAGIATRVLDKQAAGGKGLLIDSQTPDRSVLLSKVRENPPFGAVMPLGGARLTPDQVQCINAWLLAQIGTNAAVPDGGPAPSPDAAD